MKNKIGKFLVSNEMLRNKGTHKNIMKLMGRMIIVRAEQRFDKNAIEYIAMSDYFNEIAEGEKARNYQFVFANGDIRCEALAL